MGEDLFFPKAQAAAVRHGLTGKALLEMDAEQMMQKLSLLRSEVQICKSELARFAARDDEDKTDSKPTTTLPAVAATPDRTTWAQLEEQLGTTEAYLNARVHIALAACSAGWPVGPALAS